MRTIAYFNYDYYDNEKQNKLFLANPQKNIVGQLINIKDFSISPKFNNISEASFTIYEKLNDEICPIYNKIEVQKLVQVENFGWWQITDISEKYDENSDLPYKKVSLSSLEIELTGRKVYSLDGVFALYDSYNQNESILHIVANSCNWTIGTVDNSLLNKYRVLSINEDSIYRFLTQTISESFDCVFLFDTDTRTINVTKLENYGTLTNVTLSRKNIINDYVIETSSQKIATKLRVKGDDSVDIRAVNPTGMDYIINLDYYMTTDWMSQGLINALTSWKTAYSNAQSSYTTLLATLKTKQTELTTLESQLETLQIELKSYETVRGTTLSNGSTPSPSDANYATYQNAISQISAYTTQIAQKKSQIANKQSEIASVQNSLSAINNNIDMSDYFTSSQMQELDNFITEGDGYSNDTFIETEEMTPDEILDMKLDLMQLGSDELARICKPQYTITVSLKYLYSIDDNVTTFSSYKSWRDQIQVGNIVTIILRDGYSITARILEMDLDFENKDNINVVISDRSRFDDNTSELGSVIANSKSVNKSYSLNKYGYNKASNMNGEVSSFLRNALNTSVKNIYNNENQEVVNDTYGTWHKKWIPNENKYDDCMSVWTNNTLLFSDDGFQTAKAAIGKYTSGGNDYYGFFAPVLCGELTLSERLSIINQSGNFSINDNGFSAVNGQYSVNINPSTPSSIFNIKVNGANALYVDAVNKKLKFAGDISAATGTFTGSLNVNNRFIVSANGDVTLPSNATISWSNVSDKPQIPVLPSYITSTKITSTSIESPTISGGLINGTTFLSQGSGSNSNLTVRIQNGRMDASYINIEYATGGGDSTQMTPGAFVCSSSGYGDTNVVGGTISTSNVYASYVSASSMSVGGVQVATMSDLSGYASISHSHSGYATTNALNSVSSTANSAYGGVQELWNEISAIKSFIDM